MSGVPAGGKARFPILRHDFDAPVFFDNRTGPISAGRFLADCEALAARLPPTEHVVNLCVDRYRFAVGFAAALLRQQITMLPPGMLQAPIADLARTYPDVYLLHDCEIPDYGGMATLPFPDRLDGPAPTSVPAIPADRTAAILFTSGTTGAPTPHPRTWGALVHSTRAAAQALRIDQNAGAHILGTVPHQHSYGLESIIMLALQNGMVAHTTRSLLPADLLVQLGDLAAPRILITTPIHLRSLVAHDQRPPPVHRIVSATAPLAPEIAQRAEAWFGGRLFEIYGCSEIGQIAVRRTVETQEWSCIDGIDMRHEIDQTFFSGRSAAAEAPVQDLIEPTGPNRFILHGRPFDLVNIAGKRCSLSYLNHHLNAIEGIRDGIFIRADDVDDKVSRLVAYVVAPDLSAETILAALRRHVDPAFLPRPIHFVDALPRNALGKVTHDAAAQLAARPSGDDPAWSSMEWRFAADHPTAAGHFPDNPIIPGALLLDLAVRRIETSHRRPWEVRVAKFLRPVRPGDCVILRWRPTGSGDIAFECRLSESGETAMTGIVKATEK